MSQPMKLDVTNNESESIWEQDPEVRSSTRHLGPLTTESELNDESESVKITEESRWTR